MYVTQDDFNYIIGRKNKGIFRMTFVISIFKFFSQYLILNMVFNIKCLNSKLQTFYL